MATYSDPALILPGAVTATELAADAVTTAKVAAGAVGQTELDSTAKKNIADGVGGLNANAEVIQVDVMTQNYLSIAMAIG